MAYVTATKQLLGEDLHGLISTITQHEKGTPEYCRLEEFAWDQILQKYHTSVTDDHVRNCANGFVEKFLFHGFKQKAENLKMLLSYYSNLEYFKNQADGTIKWSLILLLIRLSRRPTNAERDDLPIVIEDLLKAKGDKPPPFDWGAYLKEGWEKFKLPSDDESVLFSDEEDRRNDFQLDEIPSFREKPNPFHPKLRKEPKPKLTPEEYDKLCEDKISELERWINNQVELPWWTDPMYSENIPSKHPVANFCQTWSKCQKDKGVDVGEVRLIHEYKIIEEIIFALSTANGSPTYLFDCKEGIYSVKPNISVSSLSSIRFRSVMESQFCKYLPCIATLVQFDTTVSQMNLMDHGLSNTYVAYSKAIGDILNNFRVELAATEELWRKREGIITIRTISHRLRPWLKSLEFLSHIHSKAIYLNFTKVETWKCSLRLLSVLLNEMKLISNSRLKKIALGLFLNSIEIYLRIIGSMIKGIKNPDHKNEFLIYECRDSKILKVRKYSSFLWEQSISPSEFWDPFISSCFRAISSTHFITQLDKRSTFRTLNTDVGVLLLDIIEDLKTCISHTSTIVEVEEEVTMIPPLVQKPNEKEIKTPTFSYTHSTKGCVMMAKIFDDCYKPRQCLIVQETPTDKFMKCLKDCDLTTFPITIFIAKVFSSVIHKHMEPVGFAFDALINEFKLLEHLQCLRKVFFLQIMEPFVFSLFEKIVQKSQRSSSWTAKLRECILEHFDQKTSDQYQCIVSQISLIESNHPKFVHESLSFTRIVYQPKVYLKVVIPDSCIKAYNEIFRFLLQVKWAYYIITKHFNFRGVKESHANVLLYKRMYLLRIRLVNIMTCFRNYFFSMDEKSFEEKIKRLCHEARDLQTIERAHKDFLVECKLRCFLNRRNECRVLVEALLVLTFKCVKQWWLRENMTRWDLEALENEYAGTMLKLVTQLQKYEQQFSGVLGSHFSLFQNELAINMPRNLPAKILNGDQKFSSESSSLSSIRAQ
uniref:Gamma-tubulin complex component n=2 Tax=Lygus hesperus TaxID=30085 RepID=A0A146KZX8_LYGHE